MKFPLRSFAATATLLGLVAATSVGATDVATRPLTAGGLVKPNVIFAYDNSSSMEWEILLDTTQGNLWWSDTSKTGWDTTGKPLANGDCGYGHLFPLAGDFYSAACSGSWGAALPPLKQFAAMRSSAYNPLYFDPAVTYSPWPSANVSGTLRTFAPAVPSAAIKHPILATSTTMNLTANQTVTYSIRPGMILPGQTTVQTKTSSVALSYYPAAYWSVETCTVSTPDETCAYAPNSTTVTLKRHDIAAGTPEMQNFANWWTYYRSRQLMAAGSMGKVMEQVSGVRVGVRYFNNPTTPSLLDADDAANRMNVAGLFYKAAIASGTKTHDTLVSIGEQYRTDTNVIQYSCQRNNAFIVTDGFADITPTLNPNPLTYDKAKYASNVAPYETTTQTTTASKQTLANIALSYYTSMDTSGTQTMRGSLAMGNVPLGSSRDTNPNLHMNTYAVTLGLTGNLYSTTADPYTTFPNWTATPPTIGDKSTIDDLWHATINGRGQMYVAHNYLDLSANVVEGLDDMQSALGGQSSVAVPSVNLGRGDGYVYTSSFNAEGWTGDINAFKINKTTGELDTGKTWSAAGVLAARDWKTRVIATSDGSVGSAFNATTLGSTIDQAEYLRGNRSKEGNTFRKRKGLIGAIINSQPVVSLSDGVLYVASGEGMLHAFDTKSGSEGNELWAYAPQSALSTMVKSTSRTWGFRTLLDSSPTLAQVGSNKLLIGGRGAAGPGYYALDVTSPRGLTESDLISRVKWEFPTKQGVTTAGLAVGKPVVVETRTQGTVALLPQGYNGSNDGSGKTPLLYMLDAMSGALKHTFSATTGTSTEDRGMVQVSALLESDGKVVYAYGGDEKGNLWKFDLEAKAVTRLAQLKDVAGLPQPITSAPELERNNGDVIVLVGTGRLVGLQDFDATGVQSFYAIKDGAELSNPRSGLTLRTVAKPAASTHWDISGSSFNWNSSRGWYFDLPAGQQANTDPVIVDGAVAFNSNLMSKSNCKGSSFRYLVSVDAGLRVGDLDAMRELGNTISSGLVAVGSVDGRRELLWQRGNGTIDGEHLPPPPGPPTRKNAWRQVHRN